MKNFKRFMYEMLIKYYGGRIGLCVDGFEYAHLQGDHRGMEYWDKLIAKYLSKEEKYQIKLEAL